MNTMKQMFVFTVLAVLSGVFLSTTHAAPTIEDEKNSEFSRLSNLVPMESNFASNQWMPYFFSTKMNKRDDDMPPGFIGVRGRRSNPIYLDPNLEELYRKMAQSMAHQAGLNMLISPADAKGLMKKGDSTNVYKDGFLGVRG